MTTTDTSHDDHDDHECRHCSGLCAGRASKCPYCKRWLRRDAAEWASATRSGGVTTSGGVARSALTTG